MFWQLRFVASHVKFQNKCGVCFYRPLFVSPHYLCSMKQPDSFLQVNSKLAQILEKRRERDQLRRLQVLEGIDFCSNDYLGFARSESLQHKWKEEVLKSHARLGSTGSRSISGHCEMAARLESDLASFHQAEATLLFNSGYDANVGLFSSLPGRTDHLVTDELIHASIIDGCRLSYATRHRFRHNDVNDLENQLKGVNAHRLPGSQVFVAVESVYSMDGDEAPLKELVDCCEKYEALLIVDEAHATGVFGPAGQGLVGAAGLEHRVWARVHTFGKALGTHGAIVAGPAVLKEYLLNHARSFIFTTALPPHAIAGIKLAYGALSEPGFSAQPLFELIRYFKKTIQPPPGTWLIPSDSPIQSLVIPGSTRAARVGSGLLQQGFAVKAIQHPSVAEGKERLRISLHLHNTPEEIDRLAAAMHQFS